MAAAYVKELKSGGASHNSSSSTFVVTLDATAASGSCVIALVVVDSGNVVSSAADSRSNTWTVDKSHASGPRCSICSTMQDTAALQSGDTVTFTISAASVGKAALIEEFSGVAAASRVDATQSATATTTNRDAGTVTTTFANDLIVCAYSHGAAETSFTHGTNFQDFTTKFVGSSPNLTTIAGQYQIATSATGYATAATAGTSIGSNGIAVAYKAAATAPPPATPAQFIYLRGNR